MENALESGSAKASGANHQFVTFFVSDLFLGVEVQKVQEVLLYQHMTPVPRAARTVKGLINLRGQIVTAVDLRRCLQLDDAGPDSELPLNVVIRSEVGAVSLLVDSIGDVMDVSEDTFEPPPETLSGVAQELVTGVYKLDGRLLLALSTEKMLRREAAN